MERRRSRIVLMVLLLTGAAAGAWSLLSSGQTEEDRVRLVLDECEAAFESGEVGDITSRLHPQYTDSLGNDRAGAEGYLKLLLVLQKRRYSFDRREETIQVEGDSAKIAFVAAGSERQGDQVLPSGMGSWDVTGEMRREGGDWTIYRLDLKRRRE